MLLKILYSVLSLTQRVQETNFSFDEQQRVGSLSHLQVLSQSIQRNFLDLNFPDKKDPSSWPGIIFFYVEWWYGERSDAGVEAADHIDIHTTHPVLVSKVGSV